MKSLKRQILPPTKKFLIEFITLLPGPQISQRFSAIFDNFFLVHGEQLAIFHHQAAIDDACLHARGLVRRYQPLDDVILFEAAHGCRV